jgi:hypothetical protein
MTGKAGRAPTITPARHGIVAVVTPAQRFVPAARQCSNDTALANKRRRALIFHTAECVVKKRNITHSNGLACGRRDLQRSGSGTLMIQQSRKFTTSEKGKVNNMYCDQSNLSKMSSD